MCKLKGGDINTLEYLSSNSRHENRYSQRDDELPIIDHRKVLLDDPYWSEFYENSHMGSPEQLKF